jgi:hypothetical protein
MEPLEPVLADQVVAKVVGIGFGGGGDDDETIGSYEKEKKKE